MCETVENASATCEENAWITGLFTHCERPFEMCKIAKLSFVAGAEIPKKYVVS